MRKNINYRNALLFLSLLWIITVIVSVKILFSLNVSANTNSEQLGRLIDEAQEMLDNTYVSYVGGADIPATNHWVTQDRYTEFENAIADAQRVLNNYKKSNLELNGTHVSKTISIVPGSENYIDVTLSLDANSGVYSFLVDLVFDDTKLTPVSFTDESDFQDFQITLPPLDGGLYPNRRIFVCFIMDGKSYETGLIATARFRVDGEIDHTLPLALGQLDLLLLDENGKYIIISTLPSYDDEPEFDTFSNSSWNRYSGGDVNKSGQINLTDAKLLAGYLIGYKVGDDFNFDTADANMDGRIDLTDLSYILRRISGISVFHGLQMNYRILVNNSGGATISQAQNTINAIAPGFRDILRTNLVRENSAVEPALRRQCSCSGAVCGPPGCEEANNLYQCSTLHGRSAQSLVTVPSASRSSSANTFRFVDYNLCHFYPSPRNHDKVDGLASSANMDMIVAFTKDDEDFRKWITAHEISHLIGAPDNRCTPHEECVMRNTATVYKEWCTNCISAIRSKR